jgi:2,3-bisphosphoglycerate-dependent phosphoglycerate mutase
MNTLIALLSRHGQDPENQTNHFRGRIDEPLDDKGKQQAQDLADFIIQRYTVERIVSSPLLRALETAEIIAQQFGLPVIQERSLMSMDTGFLTGEDQDEFKDVYQFFLENPSLKIPRGESQDDLHERIGGFFEQELKNGIFTLYSAHSSSGVVLANLARGNRDLDPGIDHLTEPGGLCEVHWDGGSYEIVPVFQESTKETPQNV